GSRPARIWRPEKDRAATESPPPRRTAFPINQSTAPGLARGTRHVSPLASPRAAARRRRDAHPDHAAKVAHGIAGRLVVRVALGQHLPHRGLERLARPVAGGAEVRDDDRLVVAPAIFGPLEVV